MQIRNFIPTNSTYTGIDFDPIQAWFINIKYADVELKMIRVAASKLSYLLHWKMRDYKRNIIDNLR